MQEEPSIQETEWLRSPISEKAQRLQPMESLFLHPFYGPKRRVKVFRSRITLGKGQECDIQIDDPFVSSVHAEIRLEAEGRGYSVHDLGSQNGVFLNGVRVQAAPLPSQGTLRLGRSTLSWCEAAGAEEFESGWVVADPAMRALVESLKRIARSNLPVLMLGETGTGKDVLARLLHQWGNGASSPFVPVNGALTGGTLAESELFGHRKGAFTGADSPRLGALRSAHGGTLFLDEVADVPLSAQVKLLRALETGEVKAMGADVPEKAEFRVITATSRDIEGKLQDGSFRLDLYYRIAGFVVHVPPLRERPKDTIAISRQFASERGFELDGETEARLLAYRWPGNVRELRSCVGRAIVIARSESMARLLPHHLVGLEQSLPFANKEENRGRTLEEFERQCILWALERHGWQRTSAAKELGIARSTLLQKMDKFGLRGQAAANSIEPPGSE